MSDVKVKARGVNNKSLFNEINDTIYESIATLGVKWSSESHRESFVEIIEDYLTDLEDEGKIEQSKVICDKRNNKTFSNLAEKITFEIRFKQQGCLNVTSICYHTTNRRTTNSGFRR